MSARLLEMTNKWHIHNYHISTFFISVIELLNINTAGKTKTVLRY